MAQQTTPSQQFVAVERVEDDVLYVRGGGLRMVLIVSGINFELKSPEEQEIILGTFQKFMNTLDFSVQFFIHSRKVNIGPYLEQIRGRRGEEANELLKVQIDDYVSFVESFVAENPIIMKTFFVVVPYDPITVPEGARGILGFFKKNHTRQQATQTNEAQKALVQLHQRVSQVTSELESIGLHITPLGNEELVELFYNVYNPQLVEKEGPRQEKA